MVFENTLTWGVVPGKNIDVHIEVSWKISDLEDFPKFRGIGFGYGYVKTPLKTDKRGTTKWSFALIQIDDTGEYKVELVGYLYTRNVKAKASFTIKDKDGKTKSIGSDVDIKIDRKQFYALSDTFLDPDGPVTIFCEIVIKDVEAGKKVDKMKELLTNAKEYHSDVILECEDGEVDCHKNILCLNSSYFKVGLSVCLIKE